MLLGWADARTSNTIAVHFLPEKQKVGYNLKLGSAGSAMTNDLGSVFDAADAATDRMISLICDPDVSQVTVDGYDRVNFIDSKGAQTADRMFAHPAAYVAFLNHLLSLTDAGYVNVEGANLSFIEGSFRPDRINVHGSIHIATRDVTRGEPGLTVRKQPQNIISLDKMLAQGMLNPDMRIFLETAVRGRSNILVSGGSGAGKTTLTRALTSFIDPLQRVVTAEEIDELHLRDRLRNVEALTTFRKHDEQGRLIRETTLEDLVREALRMRPDRILVGETRGKEAYALVKACNSGHDGSTTTLHADDATQAVRQLVTYVMESGLTEVPARDQVARAFHLVVQISKTRMQRRVITEITALEPVMEGTNQRYIPLWKFNHDTGLHEFLAPSLPKRLLDHWAVHGANFDAAPPANWRRR